MGRWGVAGLCGLLVCSFGANADAEPREHVLPERNDDRIARQGTWAAAGPWLQSQAVPGDGYRVSAMVSVHDARTVPLQARGVMADASGACAPGRDAGPWTDMEETFSGGELRVAVVDLTERFPCAQIRMPVGDDAVVGNLQWELLDPRFPDVGAASRSLVARDAPQFAIPSELETIGVISREEWGARATGCSSLEDDWYRMAVHHTAGPQTANDSVIERLQGTQAYAMDSGGYCDIPYQMMVGFDGSLYEGRGVDFTSGATGGGNNPGNLAVCFIGCYHEPESQCVGEVGHQPTEAMMLRGQLLIQTLVRLEDIPTTEDDIRGHRDWPGNSTACPGARLHPRLGELREDLTWFAGTELDRSWEDAEIEIPIGASTELWIELENTGGLPWVPGETFLAPTQPRDTESPLYDEAWPSTTRAATVDEQVEPGETGRFLLTISTSTEDPVTQSFGLVHEGITWFADPPWGGGPTDADVVVTARGTRVESGSSGGEETAGGDSSTGLGGGTDSGDSDDDPTGDDEGSTGDPNTTAALPPADGGDSGCGCRSGAGGAPWALGLFGLALARRRRN